MSRKFTIGNKSLNSKCLEIVNVCVPYPQSPKQLSQLSTIHELPIPNCLGVKVTHVSNISSTARTNDELGELNMYNISSISRTTMYEPMGTRNKSPNFQMVSPRVYHMAIPYPHPNLQTTIGR
ncbi:hypothetical protein AVEN_4843-1 [Araneus ventricosus]|uniref:Uncharacterized protein n=1 Tax=Araneus ventricosus TaxID=182803 RepID=A0A4Y2L6H5_ARAVE|nr:hypothetical protein AVEN_4843-1 [Araneus ventricosus]